MPTPQQIKDVKYQRRLREDKLGAEVIDESRVQLMLKFRFLDLALWRMDLQPHRLGMRYPMATDGKLVYYDPPRVMVRFTADYNEQVRDYLHMVMHCVFRHPFIEDHTNTEAWWLTCDIIIESVVQDMCGGRFACPDDKDRQAAVDELRMLVGSFTPAKVYEFLKAVVLAPEGASVRGIGASRLADYHALFERDNHESWPASASAVKDDVPDEPGELQEYAEDQPESKEDGTALETASDSDLDADACAGEVSMLPSQEDDNRTDGSEEAIDGGGDVQEGAAPEQGPQQVPSNGEDRSNAQEQQHEWEDVAKQIEMNLETFSREWGSEAGSLVASLRIANRKTYDYTDFLRKFMTINEEMRMNEDEFDYVYYTFGMDLYGKTPLIEPLEYKDTHTLHEFVVCLDTSESVNGPLVKRFVEHTFNILKESESFSTNVNIHIIQCDSRVQADMRIRDLRDVDHLMENFRIRGFGGTDFRPAFDYVQKLRDTGELTDLKGLIYFTDGIGQFPEATPDFDCAFVFVDNGEAHLPPVPPWAMRVVLDEAGINRFKSSAPGAL